ncbi:MAG: DNA primase [Candidatus Eremiobacteraeota bacterium]|nr:DNA primase [Candidatus Eremiobacteraeota bacterium]
MRIDPAITREILSRTDLAALIGQYVSLHKRGRDLVGLCPFHAEKTPSFHAHPDQGYWKCFGCGKGGDAIRFVMELENLKFPEAARLLAKRAGIEVEPEDPHAARRRNEREAIYEANRVAAAFYHRLLLMDDRAQAARDYCEKRGIGRATIEAFQLGFAPNEWSALGDELRRNGIEPEVALQAGLVKARAEGRGVYDVFRHRLMVPTSSTTGEIVAFGGRALGDENPKYLNTGTTPVHTKGRFLYALNVARRGASKAGALIVVEGYLDCIALHQAGFDNAVASLGTAFTAEQAAELRKYAENVYVCFDADAAGQAATAKSIELLREAGCSARIVALPPGEDPDTFVRAKGAAAFRERLDAAVPWVEFVLDREIARIAGGFTGAAEIARRAERLVRSLPMEEWDRWRVYVANRLRLAPADLQNSRFYADLSRFAPRGAAGAKMTRHLSAAPKRVSFERDVVAAFAEEPLLLEEYAGRIEAEAFSDPVIREILHQLYAGRGDLRTTADVTALVAERSDLVALLTELQLNERSKHRRFEESAQRREFLDRVAALLDARRRAAEVRSELVVLEREIESLHAADRPIPKEIRERQNQLEDALRETERKRTRKEVNAPDHGA